jgi:hypothetical protein
MFLDHTNGFHRNIKFTIQIERDSHFPFLDIDIYRRPDGWAKMSTKNLPTQTSTWTLDHTTIPLTDKPFSQIWCTEAGHNVTRKASSRPLQGKMGIVWSRNDVPSTWQLEPQNQKTSPPHSPAACPDDIRLARQNDGQTHHQMSWPAA